LVRRDRGHVPHRRGTHIAQAAINQATALLRIDHMHVTCSPLKDKGEGDGDGAVLVMEEGYRD
jgi:hypothetical protein